MSNKETYGVVAGKDTHITGHFDVDGDNFVPFRFSGSLQPPVETFQAIDAVLRYRSIDQLQGKYTICRSSRVGPDDIQFTLVSDEGRGTLFITGQIHYTGSETRVLGNLTWMKAL